MSPEAVRGERPTPAFDVWALSVVLYEVIAGRRPFEGADSNQIFSRVLADKRPDLAQVYPLCPPPISALFGRLLALNPAVRPQSARGLRDALESLQGQEGIR
jgi:serine/threonine-protein kinase